MNVFRLRCATDLPTAAPSPLPTTSATRTPTPVPAPPTPVPAPSDPPSLSNSNGGSDANSTGTPPWAIALILIAVLGPIVAAAVCRQRSRSAVNKRPLQEFDEHGTVLSRTNTIDMVHNPLRAPRTTATPGPDVNAGAGTYDTVEPPPGSSAETSSANNACTLLDPAQPAAHMAARSNAAGPTSYANPAFAHGAAAASSDGSAMLPSAAAQAPANHALPSLATAVPVPDPALPTHGTVEATHYSQYQGPGTVQATEYAACQVVSVPNPNVGAGAVDSRREMNDQGYMANHAIIAPVNGGGHVYAIPMEEETSTV